MFNNISLDIPRQYFLYLYEAVAWKSNMCEGAAKNQQIKHVRTSEEPTNQLINQASYPAKPKYLGVTKFP